MSHSAADGYAPPPEVLRSSLSSTPSKRRVVRVPFPPGYRGSREDTSHRALAYDSTTDCEQDDVNDDCNILAFGMCSFLLFRSRLVCGGGGGVGGGGGGSWSAA